MQTVQSSSVRSSYSAQTRETNWINESKVIAENMLHIPIKTEDRRNTDIRVIFGSLSSGIHLLCRGLVFTYNCNSLLVIQRKQDDIGRNTIIPS